MILTERSLLYAGNSALDNGAHSEERFLQHSSQRAPTYSASRAMRKLGNGNWEVGSEKWKVGVGKREVGMAYVPLSSSCVQPIS